MVCTRWSLHPLTGSLAPEWFRGLTVPVHAGVSRARGKLILRGVGVPAYTSIEFSGVKFCGTNQAAEKYIKSLLENEVEQ